MGMLKKDSDLLRCTVREPRFRDTYLTWWRINTAVITSAGLVFILVTWRFQLLLHQHRHILRSSGTGSGLVFVLHSAFIQHW